MTTIYDIDEQLLLLDSLMDEWAMENEGDITDFPLSDELKLLEKEREQKILNVAAWIKNLRSDVEGFKSEITSLQRKKKYAENKILRLTSFISTSLHVGEKMKDTRCSLNWRKSSQVIIDVPREYLPPEFTKTKIEPDKTALKTFIKREGACDFAHIEERFNLQIT